MIQPDTFIGIDLDSVPILWYSGLSTEIITPLELIVS
jgi:hypothetical protein